MPETTNRQLAELIEPLIPEPGYRASLVPGVDLIRAETSLPRHPLEYAPRIFVLAQGRKRVWFGDECLIYDANNFMVTSVPLPLECETTASPEEPLLGLAINIDPVIVGELQLEMDEVGLGDPKAGVRASALTADVIDVATRLAQALHSPADAKILGPALVRELVFRVLMSDSGDVLRLLTAGSNRYGQIARVLRRIHEDFASELDIPSLAREANMGTSTFHQAFREVTANSPLQYLKQIRLHRARTLLASKRVTAQEAAMAVGYASPAQFSREYRRMFGVTPASDRTASVA